jgi:hypothetical protein
MTRVARITHRGVDNRHSFNEIFVTDQALGGIRLHQGRVLGRESRDHSCAKQADSHSQYLEVIEWSHLLKHCPSGKPILPFFSTNTYHRVENSPEPKKA